MCAIYVCACMHVHMHEYTCISLRLRRLQLESFLENEVVDILGVDSLESSTQIPLMLRSAVRLDPVVLFGVARLVSFKEVVLRFLSINSIHLTSTMVALLEPSL